MGRAQRIPNARAALVWAGAGALVLALGLWLARDGAAPPPSSDLPALAASELAPERAPALVPLAPDSVDSLGASPRDRVEVAAGAVAGAAYVVTEPPVDRFRWQARLLLQDGTPPPVAQVVALARGAEPGIAWIPASVSPQPREILARGTSDEEGLLTLEFPRWAAEHGGADLYVARDSRLRPDPQTIDVKGPQPAELRYRGGTIVVHVRNARGEPVQGASVRARWAEPAEDGSEPPPFVSGSSDESGRVRLIFFEAGVGEILAIGKNGSAVARLSDVRFEPSSTEDGVTMVLGQEGLTGRLEVELAGPSGAPVRDFALRFESLALPGFRRFVDSSAIGPDRIVDGLPPGAARIEISRVYREPPSLLRDEGFAPHPVELHADRIAVFRAVVPLAARWRLDVAAAQESFAPLELHVRRADQGDAAWKKEHRIWQFLVGGGAQQNAYLDTPGVYYSHEMDPGRYDVELRGSASGEVLWRASVTLLEGEISPLAVQL